MKERDWKLGILVSEKRMTEIGRNVVHRYLCTIADGELLYTVEFEKPLKTATNEPIKFVIEKGWLILQDADGKERSARIEKRERKLKQ